MTAPFTPEDLAWFEEQKVVVPPVMTTETPRIARKPLPPGLVVGVAISVVSVVLALLVSALVGGGSWAPAPAAPAPPPAPVLPSAATVAQTLQGLGTITTTSGLIKDVVQDDRTPEFGAALIGEKVTLFAQGTAASTIDFTKVGTGDVDTDGTQATITLPAPVLGKVVMDPVQTRIVGHEQGLLNRLVDVIDGADPDYRPLYAAAQDKLDTDAAADPLISRDAAEQARARVTAVVEGMGYDDVQVVFDH